MSHGRLRRIAAAALFAISATLAALAFAVVAPEASPATLPAPLPAVTAPPGQSLLPPQSTPSAPAVTAPLPALPSLAVPEVPSALPSTPKSAQAVSAPSARRAPAARSPSPGTSRGPASSIPARPLRQSRVGPPLGRSRRAGHATGFNGSVAATRKPSGARGGQRASLKSGTAPSRSRHSVASKRTDLAAVEKHSGGVGQFIKRHSRTKLFQFLGDPGSAGGPLWVVAALIALALSVSVFTVTRSIRRSPGS